MSGLEYDFKLFVVVFDENNQNDVQASSFQTQRLMSTQESAIIWIINKRLTINATTNEKANKRKHASLKPASQTGPRT